MELVTSTVANIRGGLATQLKVGSLYTHSTWPGIPTKPCVIVQRCEPEFDQTLGPSTVVRYSVELAVLCLATALIDAQVELDTYLSPTGTASLHAAIQADPTLGGVADSSWIVRVRDAGEMSANGQDVIGAIVDAEVWSS